MNSQETLDQLIEIEEVTLADGGKSKDIINAKMEFIGSLVDPQILTMEQRTDEWFAARLGVLSASTSADAMSKVKIEGCINRNLAEMALGHGEPFPMKPAMQHGIDSEDAARKAYEKHERVSVTEVGFIYLNKDMRVGCSPDGLVDDDGDMGMSEFKCPNTNTHMGYMRKGCPRNYFYQIQLQMLVNAAPWCDFVSFDPRVDDVKLNIYVQRIYRCKKTMVAMFEHLMTICATVDSVLDSKGLAWDKSQNKLISK